MERSAGNLIMRGGASTSGRKGEKGRGSKGEEGGGGGGGGEAWRQFASYHAARCRRRDEGCEGGGQNSYRKSVVVGQAMPRRQWRVEWGARCLWLLDTLTQERLPDAYRDAVLKIHVAGADGRARGDSRGKKTVADHMSQEGGV
jgi:hypothetical protein